MIRSPDVFESHRTVRKEGEYLMLVIFIILTVCLLLSLGIMAWFASVAGRGLIRPRQERGKGQPKHRFAVVVCAKNEEHVLVHLFNSIRRQDYPADHWHIYLLADHCSDHTADVGRKYDFVTVYERKDGPTNGKGYVLKWGLSKILKEHGNEFDAFIFFDADNVAEKSFMTHMNEALNKGADVIQGNRLAGEPYTTFVTKWYAIYWTLYSFFYSYPREKLGYSCFLTGTGFAVKKELIQKYGWNTSTITEDVEFSFQQCLRGRRVSFNVDAICYDEQPSDLHTMIRQLTRWCTGSYQIFKHYFSKWVREFTLHPSVKLFDNFCLLMMGPASIVMFLSSNLLSLIFPLHYPGSDLVGFLFFLLGIVFTWIGERGTTKYVGIPMYRLGLAFYTFPIFLWIYMFCSLFALIWPQRGWKPIAHQGLNDEEGPLEEAS